MSLRTFSPEELDVSRQFLLDRRCERNHPKRHRTKARKKAISERKRAKVVHNKIFAAVSRKRFLEASRAYWDGTALGHP